MNTIPTTFNASGTSYTALGGAHPVHHTGLSVILLNRGGRYLRRVTFERLEKLGFDQVVSIENPRDSYDLEELSIRFPFVRFLLLNTAVTLGEQINLAAAELSGPWFCTLWNDVSAVQGGPASRMAAFLAERREVCLVPALLNSRLEPLPTQRMPAMGRGRLRTLPFTPSLEAQTSLYPAGGVGFFRKEAFIQLGGFDPTIAAPYWQMLDFGFRAWLWGETIRTTQAIRLIHDGEIPAEDETVNESAKQFYLKNLAPVYRKDSAHLPLRAFVSYLVRSGVSPFEAWKEFRLGRDWVSTNTFRFKRDARNLVENWEKLDA